MVSKSLSHRATKIPEINYTSMGEPIHGFKEVILKTEDRKGADLYFCIMTHDCEPYLSHSLRNIYRHAARIVVIEGNVEEFWHLPFTDYTERVVSEVDADKKIVYRHLGRVQDKSDLVGAGLDILRTMAKRNDFVIVMGADEAWSHDALDWLLTLPEEILWVGVPFYDFYGDFRHHRVLSWAMGGDIPDHKKCGFRAFDRNGKFLVNGMYQERVYRIRDGWNYKENHTAIKDAQQRYIYADPFYQEQRIFLDLKNAQWFHYGYVGCKDWLREKIGYYSKKLGRFDPDTAASKGVKYRYAETGDPDLFGPDYELREVPDGFIHPPPMPDHPYAKMTREEIFNSPKWT